MVKKTIFISGAFNVLHPGHVRLLRFAKDMNGKLIVGVLSDRFAGKAAYINENLRLEGFSPNNLFDKAVIIDGPMEDFIKKLKPDIIVKGKENKKKLKVEKEI